MNQSLKNGLVGAGVAGALILGGQAFLSEDDASKVKNSIDSSTYESDTDFSATRDNLSSGESDKDCGDFSTQAEAQDFYESQGPGDPHGLDRDNDGEVCETLP